MSLFRRRKEFNTAATSTFPAGPPASGTVNHYYPPSRVGTILTLFGVLIGMAILSWHGLVFLAGQMEIARPERAVASWLFGVGLVILVVAVAAIVGRFILFDIFAHGERMMDKRIEIERVRLLDAQTSIDPGRFTDADFEFARVVLGVMMNAYAWLEREGYATFPGRWRPWSLSSSQKTAEAMGIKLTQQRANQVSVWLSDKGVITSPDGGQITQTYPDLSNVRLLLEKEFGRPIQVITPHLRDNRGFRFTE